MFTLMVHTAPYWAYLTNINIGTEPRFGTWAVLYLNMPNQPHVSHANTVLAWYRHGV